MKINEKISQQIVEELSIITGRNINIMGNSGIIIASTNKDRVGEFHGGAQVVISTGESVYITDSTKYEQTKNGINLPIEFRGNIVGVVGITGDVDEVEKYANIIKKVSEIMLKESFKEQDKQIIGGMISTVIMQLLYHDNIDTERIIDTSTQLGIYSNHPKYLAFLRFTGDKDEYELQRLLNEVQTKLDSVLRYYNKKYYYTKINDGIMIVINCEGNGYGEIERIFGRLSGQIGEPYRVGISEIYNDFFGLKNSYREAKVALSVAEKWAKDIVFFGDLDIDILIESTKEETLAFIVKSVFCFFQCCKNITSKVQTASHTGQVDFLINCQT